MDMQEYIKTARELEDLGYEVITNFDNGEFNVIVKKVVMKIGGIKTITGVEAIMKQRLNKLLRMKKINNIIDED
jgi:hypothetical protein